MDDARQYKTFRVKPDLAPKLDDLLQVLGESSPDYLDPLIRRQIENDHKQHAKAIQAMHEARAARDRGDDPAEGHDLGDPGA